MTAPNPPGLTPAPPNNHGWTHYRATEFGPFLTQSLDSQGIAWTFAPIPHLCGPGGAASLIFYESAKHPGVPVTVLCVPHRMKDAYMEEYFFFAGLSRHDALASEDAWLDRYNDCNALRKQSKLPG